MYCDECKERPAKVHFTQVINGKQTEMHLCEECAQKKSQMNLGLHFEPGFSLQNLLAALIGQEISSYKPVGISMTAEIRCKNCGSSYREFSKSGKLGCSQCYVEFKEYLAPIIRKLHGNSYHTGKIPFRTGGVIHLKRELENLRVELKNAIEVEEYEKAAELRDKIRALVLKMDSPA